VVTALSASTAPERVLVTASGMGYYGSCGDEPLRDDRAPGPRWFLSDMISSWEAAARKAEAGGARVALMRVGLSLGRNGGALPLIEQNFQRHMGGHVGSGRQYLAWLHNEDCAAIFVRALEEAAWQGGYVVASPQPVPFAELSRAVGQRLGRRSWLHPPALLARLMIGEASAILLQSHRAAPERVLLHGFQFRHATLKSALDDLYGGAA
jgi:uncharacterized protein (TIGR01777 family)